MTLREELDALDAKATQGEWRFDGGWARLPSLVVGDVREEVIATFAKSKPPQAGPSPEQRANPLFVEALVNAYRSGQLVPLPEVEELAKVLANDTEGGWLAMPALHKVALMSQARAIIKHMKGKTDG